MCACRYRKQRFLTLLILIELLLLPAGKPQVRVDKNVFAWSGTDAILKCTAETRQSVTQITWQRKLGHTTENFLTFSEGAPRRLIPFANRVKMLGKDKTDGSIQVENVTLADEGLYICIFTIFPDGATEAEINLHIWVAPAVRVELKPNVTSECQEAVAECLAASSKPNATIQWITGGINFTFKENASRESQGTVSKTNALYMTPTASLHGREVFCFVHQPGIPFAEQRNVTANVTLTNILYAPQTVYTEVRKEEQWLQLRCQSNASPPARYVWKRKNQSITRDGSEKTGTLNLERNEDLSGLYICEAKNDVGVNTGSVYLYKDYHLRNRLPALLLSFLVPISVLVIILWKGFSKRSTAGETSEGKSSSDSPLRCPKSKEEGETCENEPLNMVDRTDGATCSDSLD